MIKCIEFDNYIPLSYIHVQIPVGYYAAGCILRFVMRNRKGEKEVFERECFDYHVEIDLSFDLASS